MSSENENQVNELSERVNELARCFEEGRTEDADKLLDEISNLREHSLFQELGKLTRQFHDALNSFRLDARISSLAEKEFPDARDRLRYVIDMTAQSANRSLSAVETAMPICDTIYSDAHSLRNEWERFTNRELDAGQFRELSKRVGVFLHELDGGVVTMRDNLNEITMAQDFQDLTGQIIGKVITLVDEMEGSLVELVKITGKNMVVSGEESAIENEPDIEAAGPHVPGVDRADSVVSGQDEVDDLLSSLGF